MESIYNNSKLIIDKIDTLLRNKYGNTQPKKLWENTYIKHQIDKREKGQSFSLQQHIRGMVYSMLSSSISWERVERSIDIKTGAIKAVDDIFHDFDVKYLLKCIPFELVEQIKAIGCAGQSTQKQMNALINDNIPQLQNYEMKYGSIDNYYKNFIIKDRTLKSLVRTLSSFNSENKIKEMGEALTAEYLRNVGYNIAKPDRHITRILGSNCLGFHNKEIVPVYNVFDIVAEIANNSNRKIAETDFILWSYCAKGYGEICTKSKPKCDKCIVKLYCYKAKQP